MVVNYFATPIIIGLTVSFSTNISNHVPEISCKNVDRDDPFISPPRWSGPAGGADLTSSDTKGVVIPLNPEGMGIGEWVILFSGNFEGMGMEMGIGMGNSKKLCA